MSKASGDKIVLNDESSSSSEDEEVQEVGSSDESDENGELSASSGDEENEAEEENEVEEENGVEEENNVEEENYVDEYNYVDFDGSENVVSFDRQRKEPRQLSKRQLAMQIEGTKNSHKLSLVKPNLVKDRERERHLSRVATKGVVQLFNAVSQRQGEMDQLFSKDSKARGKRDATEKLDKLKPDGFRKKLKGDGDNNNEDTDVKLEDVDELPDDLKFLLDGSGLGKEYAVKEDLKGEDYSD